MSRELLKDVRANHDTWITNKSRFIGSGDAPDAVWNKLSLYMRKRGLVEPQNASDLMRWGSLLEPEIAKQCISQLRSQGDNAELIDLNTCYQHDTLPWMVATPDAGITLNGQFGLIECKMVTSWGRKNWENGVSDRAHVQVHHQLEVCNDAAFCIVAVLFVPDFEFKTFTVYRDEEVRKTLLSHEAEFWGYLSSEVLPPIESPSPEEVKALYPKANTDTLILHADTEVLLQGLEFHSTERKRHEKTEEALKTELQVIMGENLRAVCGDHELLWANVTSNRFDQKRFEREQPELFKKYMKISESRRFTHKVRKLEERGK
jgi:predicted phage-related endonuclease